MTPAAPPFLPDFFRIPLKRKPRFPFPVRVERSRDTSHTVTAACLDLARHERLMWMPTSQQVH